ncbi:MAG: hypothetical protein JWM68_3658 [Verrucomicrobiales bacterium]|nr:hypothetical protein [Verrucomicrobiales bacterium]
MQELTGWSKPGVLPSTLPDCAVIVPTYRRTHEMLRLLNTVVEFANVPAEFFVIDGSPDDTVNNAIQAWAKGRLLPFRLIYVESPAGLTLQRNVGIDACEREFIFFLDDDSVPAPEYFSAIRKVFAEDTKGEVGAIRGFLTNGINKPFTKLWRLRFALGIVPRGKPGQYHHCGTSGTWDMVAPFSGIKEVDVLPGCAAAYRSEVFSKERFSDFFNGYSQGEDLEMSLRLRMRWRLVVCGDALVEHREATNGRPAGFPRGRMAARNRFFIWKRYSPRPGFVNRLRFWMDHVLAISYYGLCFMIRPWRPYHLAFASGLILGLLECLVAPPCHHERAVAREYTFKLDQIGQLPQEVFA